MKRLYYATFDKGFGEVVKKVIRKTDRNSKIKTLYDDAVLFFADEHFRFKDSCFLESFIVIHNVHKTGVGALNLTIKTLLEKKDLKIVYPREVGSIKLTIKKENDNVVVDSKLKTAFEVMLKRVTKKSFSYLAKDELVLLAKKDGENLFMKRMQIAGSFSGLAFRGDIKPETAYLLNVLSEPQPNEALVDAFAGSGVISFVRSACFIKANVIACSDVESEKENLKKLAKKLKPNTFSVLGYDFLDENFPIKFIDKIVTDLTGLGYGMLDDLRDFFDKVYDLKVKHLVVVMPKNYDVNRFIYEKYVVLNALNAEKFNVYNLKLK